MRAAIVTTGSGRRGPKNQAPPGAEFKVWFTPELAPRARLQTWVGDKGSGKTASRQAVN